MAYAGKPLANLFTMGPIANVELLRANLDAVRVHRADGDPVDLAELDTALAAVGWHLERAKAALSDYLMGPRFEIGQRVNLVSEDGTKVLKRGLCVRDVREGNVSDVIEVVDIDGRHEAHMDTQLDAAD